MKNIVAICAMICAGSINALAGDFSLTSPQFADEGRFAEAQILNGFGCTGGNISPELNWQGEPDGTKSFAVTVYDPDAPTGSGWWHWVLFNIPADIHKLPLNSGAYPASDKGTAIVQSKTDFGSLGYGGACPPEGHGDHRYQFRVWALDTAKIELDTEASAAMVGFYLNQHKLAQAKITAIYGR